MDKARLLDFAQKIKNMAKHGLEYFMDKHKKSKSP